MTVTVRTFKARHFNATQFLLEPGETSVWQHHTESEFLVCFAGEGRLSHGHDEALPETELRPGQMVLMPPLTQHRLINTGREPLVMGNVYWEDRESVHEALDRVAPGGRRRLALPSFTTPNGRMHIGHLAGPVLAADTYARAQAVSGADCYQLCGTIGYQTHVELTAAREGRGYRDTALAYSADFIANYELMSVHCDVFATLRDEDRFVRIAAEFCIGLVEAGLVVEKTEPVPYCEAHGFLFEANVRGKCPHCSAVFSAECESCAIYVPDADVVEPICNLCDTPAGRKPLRRLFVPLEPHRLVLEHYLMRGAYIDNTAEFVSRVLERPLPEIPVGIRAATGIALPFEHFADQKMYSAVELAPRFLTALQLLEEKTGPPPDDGYDLALFFGSDNNYLRCIIFPILMHLHSPTRYSFSAFFSNEFYYLNGTKFSTSRRHVLYADEVVNGEFPADWLRLYIAHTRPTAEPVDFTIENARHWTKPRMRQLQAVVERTGRALDSRHGGLMPAAGTWERAHVAFYEQLLQFAHEARHIFTVERFDLRRIAGLVDTLLTRLDAFSRDALRERHHPGIQRTGPALTLLGLRLWATIAWPVMPNTGTALLRMLGTAHTDPPLLEHALEWPPAGERFERAAEPAASDRVHM